jgi:hypothetical protein
MEKLQSREGTHESNEPEGFEKAEKYEFFSRTSKT